MSQRKQQPGPAQFVVVCFRGAVQLEQPVFPTAVHVKQVGSQLWQELSGAINFPAGQEVHSVARPPEHAKQEGLHELHMLPFKYFPWAQEEQAVVPDPVQVKQLGSQFVQVPELSNWLELQAPTHVFGDPG